MKLFYILKYLSYILFSSHKRGHGIHSPFVFNLITKVFRNKIDTDVVCNIEMIRQKMISDQRKICVTDYGSGSQMMSSNLRKVSEIAKHSAVPQKYGLLLAGLSKEFGRSHIVEFGTSLGISTLYLACGSDDTLVHTIEGCPETSKIAEENFRMAEQENIKMYTGTFDELIPSVQKESFTPGVVFIDGNHRKEPILKYFSKMTEIADSQTVIVLDDIHYSAGMEEAWEEIKKDERVSVTVDIFRMGLVFFSKGLTRSDYIIRY